MLKTYPIGKAPKKIRHKGAVLWRDLVAENGTYRHNYGSGYPYYSDAMGCHRNQVAEYRELAAKNGVPTEITDDGRVKITDRNHRRRFMKAFRYYDKDACYGDPTKTYSGDGYA